MVPQRGRQLSYRMAGFRLAITLFGAHPRAAGETATFRRATAPAAQIPTLKDVRFIGVLSE